MLTTEEESRTIILEKLIRTTPDTRDAHTQNLKVKWRAELDELNRRR